jgi:hypothetical protein
MALNICALLLVLGIIFMNSIFGLFSGLINAFCAIIAAVVALGYSEALNDLVTKQTGLHPSYSEPACLIVLFVITLVVLRMAVDKGIRGNVRVPMYLDWGGGALAGIVIGQICVGILLLGVMMLPFGGRVMQYQRYERDENNDVDDRGYVEFHRNSIWLRSDEFTTGLVNLLSNGCLRGKTPLAAVYPDFPEWVSWSGNTVQPESITAPRRDNKGDGFERGLRVALWWEPKGSLEGRYRKELPTRENQAPPYTREVYKPEAGMKLIAVQLEMDQSSADQAGKESPYHRFRPTMIRVVGDVDEQPRHYVARLLGGVDPNIGDALRIADVDNDFAISASAKTVVNAYFEVDEGFRPRFVEYRRHARAAVPREPADKPPDEALAVAAATTARPQRGSGTRSGRTGFIRTLVQPYGDTDDLPFKMSAARVRGGTDVTIDGELFVSGRIAGDQERLEASGDEAAVGKFKRPTGLRLCQIHFEPYKAQTVVGDVFNYAARTANQYSAYDNEGNQYELVGYFAIVPRRGKPYLELFFAGGQDDPLRVSFGGMLDFKHIEPRELTQEQAELGLLFLVPPGKTIREIANQQGDGVTDLRIRMRDQP